LDSLSYLGVFLSADANLLARGSLLTCVFRHVWLSCGF
jgi:hypothetical protein